MKILISEDNTRKYESIVKTITNFDSSIEIVREVTGVRTIRNAMENPYDLLIQDMMMPFRDDEKPRLQCGFLVIDKLLHRKILTNKIIVCSTENTYQLDAEGRGVKFVKYTEFDEYNWHTRLVDFIKELR